MNLIHEPHESAQKSVADELREYKELLDSGVITEEEFKELKSNCISHLQNK